MAGPQYKESDRSFAQNTIHVGNYNRSGNGQRATKTDMNYFIQFKHDSSVWEVHKTTETVFHRTCRWHKNKDLIGLTIKHSEKDKPGNNLPYLLTNIDKCPDCKDGYLQLRREAFDGIEDVEQFICLDKCCDVTYLTKWGSKRVSEHCNTTGKQNENT